MNFYYQGQGIQLITVTSLMKQLIGKLFEKIHVFREFSRLNLGTLKQDMNLYFVLIVRTIIIDSLIDSSHRFLNRPQSNSFKQLFDSNQVVAELSHFPHQFIGRQV